MNDSTKTRLNRTEFGKPRTECGCEACVENCRHIPGYLIPADLDRMIPPTEKDVFTWAEKNLLASPGALVANLGTKQTFRIPTLVPATKSNGECVHLTYQGMCKIHAISPFGCAFFDCGPADPQRDLSHKGLIEVHNAHRDQTLYAKIWQHLDRKGIRQEAPDVLRKKFYKK